MAVVTGASQGIGRATVLLLASEGALVVTVARGRQRLDEVVQVIRAAGGQAHGVAADVSTATGCTRAIDEAVRAFGAIDILVNNAGTSSIGAFEATADEVWQADLDLKVFAAVRLIRAALPHFRQRGAGSVVNVVAVGAKTPGAGSLPTTASRAAGMAITKALSREFAEAHGSTEPRSRPVRARRSWKAIRCSRSSFWPINCPPAAKRCRPARS
ncbi:MAG: SDR family NAD(P)-dependent oxidoreductase [Burkholderiaceae bacterium]